MEKGKIVLIPFPFTDLSQSKVRPCLILHSTPKSEDCIVSFISSVDHPHKNVFDVVVQPRKKNGLKSKSVVKVNKIATLQKKTIIGEIGTLENDTLSLVDKKLKNLFKI